MTLRDFWYLNLMGALVGFTMGSIVWSLVPDSRDAFTMCREMIQNGNSSATCSRGDITVSAWKDQRK